MLSPASSLATFIMDESGSNMSSPRASLHSKSRSSSLGSENRRVSGSSGRGGSSFRGEGLDAIQGQLETLESLYSDILTALEMDLKEPPPNSFPRKSKNTDDLKRRADAYKKQRSKDLRGVNQRFDRLESHLVTLARSVAHLSSELRSQAALSQELEELHKEVNDLKEKRPGSSSLLLQSQNNTSTIPNNTLELSLLHRINKLKRFFGEEPPLVALFLKKLGYERLALKFEAEQISIAELPYMTEERLQNIGIPLGPRLRILDEIRKLSK